MIAIGSRGGPESEEESSQVHYLEQRHKRGFSMPYLKCVEESEAKYILEEIHKRDMRRPRRPKILGK